MSILDKITGDDVLRAGVIGACASVGFAGWGLAATIASAVSLISVLIVHISEVTKLLTKLLNGFADVPAWPSFVLLGIAAIIAAYHGGLHGAITLAFILVAEDGNVFDALY